MIQVDVWEMVKRVKGDLGSRWISCENWPVDLGSKYRVSGKKLTQEVLNKILSFSRISFIFTWHHLKVLSNVR